MHEVTYEFKNLLWYQPMKCLLTYQLSLSLFSCKITFENINFIISSETKTQIFCLSLSISLRIFVNPGPGEFPKISRFLVSKIQSGSFLKFDHFFSSSRKSSH